MNGIETSRSNLYSHGNLIEQIDYTGAATKLKMDYKKNS